MHVLYAKNSSIIYCALLHAYGFDRLKIPAIAPTFFANIAKMMGIEISFRDVKLDFSSDADVVHNFFESFTPKAKIVFQNWGECVGDAEVFVMKRADCVKLVIKNEKIAKKVELFLDGGVQRGRLWNYDVVDVGIKNLRRPCEEDGQQAIEESNEVVEFFEEKFRGSPYFDILKIGQKTLKTQYPILLKPSLYCPKEDIFAELREKGVHVEVRFKPLYRMSFFQGDFLPGAEELYKALLLLPMKKDVVKPLFEVLDKYRYRGCSF
ncbi:MULTISPECIES: DegT/DnrJ/EryC1/StrS family aminotransferase [unclassified Nitratiruptor]|uniref:DegT/DnrJ/EryC1/StrS family aminotransferase n=1 Tax=unclassified Nitratiruptor TaxID=2624044 RepID=UPI0019152650|nr:MULTISPECIES: DegT/DnrJ/EryC1/StrS family aminotransferase [unclassified Nitratiruptor]BCD60951.1 hypothetical protein NitYY0810_C1729 [Nitratiruptor sp. YY08-10]BCD64883.1 hypothetical protein NitYY0814_C1737 [Nitratiruptor sp. YY08-14]